MEWSRVGLILFQRDDCTLCDAAIELLAAARAGDFASVFVDADAELEARYGQRVPVLRDAAGRELGWPFTLPALQSWLETQAR